jgi:DNA polymerase-3 subunit gamma/tau
MDETQEPALGLDPAPQPARAAGTPYRVLARKYRPQNFTGLIGQEALVKTLSNAFAAGRIAHAFMLTGVRGVGKTTTARIIARALNCVGPDGKRTEPTIDPCGICEFCRAIAESRCIDVQEMDGATNNGVEEVRQITDAVRYAPASARYKVYIIDEVHMLSKAAFNALLKTLEEPPPHVKFIFATTEIRKVPVTVLSRCQRFDLRRIAPEELQAHLASIAKQENIAIGADALAMLAVAAEGSVRDALSLLDQAIAHGAEEEGGSVSAENVRAMLGLADRTRILDLFELLMAGRIADGLTALKDLYDCGAEPLTVIQDLLDVTHMLTRAKVAPGAGLSLESGPAIAERVGEMAVKLSVPTLTRAWQMQLKGLIEVRDATQPLAAAEMVLVRFAYGAELPPTEKLIRTLTEKEGVSASAPAREGATPGGAPRMRVAAQALARPAADPAPRPALQPETMAIVPKSLEELVALAKEKTARLLATQLETNVHLVAIEPGRIEFRPNSQAPRTLASDLAQRLRDWTGERWIVTLASEGGAPTLVEQRQAADRAKKDAVSNEPFVRAVLDAFPGAEIVAVREEMQVESDVTAPVNEEDR